MSKENLNVGTHKYQNKKWDKGYDQIRKPCGCYLGTCTCETEPVREKRNDRKEQ